MITRIMEGIENNFPKKISTIKKFKAISPQYQRQAEITISQKKFKYTINN